ncbi:ankyrin repeat and fibronectin type-III domain-containing protein 1 isoform X3 [Lingula anatina]|uniref:Ankyrin repeat and fibronectin type-III domain-containing protein 1 isoform X3 n=1 Tax=Lingula anatina TaxID=7574 RepID=A0A1S3I2X5_LINAN|nr:ankyrin repeat and fibronectin type-III domain-containing protein 1 isoform X3 [Lingula anatina]|eukprot:XP_013391704.1 ankyrin repeat and fibronectin type-III domain-containing protein 1 isoform X3 [Lingula anatina]
MDVSLYRIDSSQDLWLSDMSADDDLDEELEYLDLSSLEDGVEDTLEHMPCTKQRCYINHCHIDLGNNSNMPRKNSEGDEDGEEEEEAEFYNFEDYEPEPMLSPMMPVIGHFCRSNTTVDECLTIPYYGPAGKQIVRSRTLPSIPIPKKTEQYVTKPDPEPCRLALHSLHVDPLLERCGNKIGFCDNKPGQRSPLPSHPSPTITRWMRTGSTDRRRRVLPKAPTVDVPPSSAWKLDEDGDSSDSVATSTEDTGNFSRAPSQLFYTTPPKTQMAAMVGDHSCGDRQSSTSRLGRKLSEREKRKDSKKGKMHQRSHSVDYSDGQLPEPQPVFVDRVLHASPSAPGKLSKMAVSGSISPSGRLVRSLSGTSKRKGSVDSTENEVANKPERKKSDKKNNNVRYDINDLFDAVEHQDMDLAKLILEAEDLDVNSMNEEELTPLDVAVMTNHVPMAKMLLTLGAKENPKFLQENRSLQLNTLMNDTYKKVVDLTSMVVNSGGNIGSGKDYDRELSHWEFRHRLLKRMKAGYEHARVPDAPASARLSVASAESLTVRFDEPDQHNGAVVTRYKVEWSCFETFSPLAGEAILEDVRHLEYDIPGLTQGNVYYVQVTAWNIKGWGPPTPTSPPYAIPSSWREVSGVKPRNEGKLQLLDDLFSQVRASRPADASEIKDNQPTGSPSYQRKNTVRKSIKNLFTSAPKFQKNLKRGVYLASLVYNEDKILVTNEDHLPIVEVDENFSSASLHSDFHWMMKIACTWEDVKSLRQDIEKISSSSLVHFRSKLLQAAAQLQTALGIQDLGQFFYKPIKDSNGSIVLMTVNNIREPKQVNSAAMKWMPFSKVHKRMSVSDAGLVCPELLMTMVNEMILYHQLSTMVLPKGLYLGYLKLKSTVDLIRMLVAEKSPNVLPYTKIRNCPNVSKEEWEWLQSLGVNEAKSDPTQAQQDFCGQLVESTKRLLETLGVSDDEAVTHRLFEMEVIEFSPDVCFILLLPPVEAVCSVPGHNDEMTDKTDFLALPVQVFEMIHMCSYQYEFISRYSRLSSILEMDTCLAQQAQREAFSSEELAVAKERIEQLTKFQQILDEAWKSMRWTMEVITYARDRGVRGGVPLGVLYAPPPSPNDSPLPNRKDVESTSSDAGYHSDKGSSTDLHSSETATVPSTGQQQGDVDMGCDDLQLLINTQNNNKPGILRVYTAYDTGLADGTSVKLHVTPKTSSREVINLVVQQLNKAVKTKGLQGPYYAEDQLEEFCLVAVIGARERILRDDYQPLQLQNPWTKGRLFVRLKSNLLAALEQGTATAV